MTARPATETAANAPAPVSYWTACRFWFWLGLVGFGGPAGQIAIMHTELVERRRWISDKRFLHALNYCMVLPGPEAQQLAIYLGSLMHRSLGGVTAGVLFVLPSLLIQIALSWVYVSHGQHWLVAGLFDGVKPVIVAVVVHAAVRIGGRVLRNVWLCTIALSAVVAMSVLAVPFPIVLAAAALTGLVGQRLAPALFVLAAEHAAATREVGPAWIDDHMPTATHARFRVAGLLRVLAVCLLLWLIPIALLALGFGWEHQLTQMALYFTTAALLTFGGAYAALTRCCRTWPKARSSTTAG